MKLRRFNRSRQQIITFTGADGIKRDAIIMRDNLKNAKQPPAWMQELMRDLEQLEQQKKGA